MHKPSASAFATPEPFCTVRYHFQTAGYSDTADGNGSHHGYQFNLPGGLMVYDSVKNQLMVNMGTAQLPDWENIAANAGWSLNR